MNSFWFKYFFLLKSHRALEDGKAELISEWRRSRASEEPIEYEYNMFIGLCSQVSCVINELADNTDVMSRFLFTKEETANGILDFPREKQRELLRLKTGESLPSSAEAFTQEYSPIQPETQFIYSFEPWQVSKDNLPGADVGDNHIEFSIPDIKVLKKIIGETHTAIVR